MTRYSLKMRLSAFAHLATFGFLASVVADRLDTVHYCRLDEPGCHTQGTWHSGYGTYMITSVPDGCGGVPVPGMKTLCLDLPENRGHFFFDGQPKRCLDRTDTTTWRECPNAENCATLATWNEIPCTW